MNGQCEKHADSKDTDQSLRRHGSSLFAVLWQQNHVSSKPVSWSRIASMPRLGGAMCTMLIESGTWWTLLQMNADLVADFGTEASDVERVYKLFDARAGDAAVLATARACAGPPSFAGERCKSGDGCN